MKKLLIASAIIATFAAPQAFAQAKNFEGFSLTGALNINNNKGEIVIISPASTSSESRTETNVGVQAEYGLALGESFVLGLGATAGLSDFNASSSIKIKNTYGFYLTPGIALSKDTLVYAKLASISAKASDSTTTIDVSGTGYGIGVRYLSSKSVFFQVEYTSNKYDDKVYSNGRLKNETGVLALGVGYKF